KAQCKQKRYDSGSKSEQFVKLGFVTDLSARNESKNRKNVSSQKRRRLAAIMFTDIVGYTLLGQQNESLSLSLLEEQRKLVREILNRHNGREVKTIGNELLIEFPSALDAVRCSYDIKGKAREHNAPLAEEKRVHLRIGIHLGDVVESEGDISGDAVKIGRAHV